LLSRFAHDHQIEAPIQSGEVKVVRGNLNLHGQTHPVAIDVTLKDGIYRGSTTPIQTAFGITPVSVAGGTVKVKDEVKLEFQISLVE